MPPERSTFPSPHFGVHCAPGSFAGVNPGPVMARLEATFAVVGDLLGLEPTADERIDVYLSELPGAPGAAQGAADAATRRTGTGEIHETYRADAPGPGLEQAVLLARLARALGPDKPVARFLVDGLMGVVARRLGALRPPDSSRPPGPPPAGGALLASAPPSPVPITSETAMGPGGGADHPGSAWPATAGPALGGPIPDGRPAPPSAGARGPGGPVPPRPGGPPGPAGPPPALLEARALRTLPPLRVLLSDPAAAPRPVYHGAAATFVDFLLRTYGPRQFLVLLTALDPRQPDEGTRAAYHRTLSDLEKAWLRTLVGPRGAGVMQLLRGLVPYFRPHVWSVLEILVEIAAVVGYSSFVAAIQKPLINDGIIAGNLSVVVQIIGELVGLFVLVSLIGLRQNRVTAHLTQDVLSAIRFRIFTLLQRLDAGFFQQAQTGDIISRLTSDVAQVEVAVSMGLVQTTRMLLMLVVAGLTMLLQNPRFAVVLLLITPLFFVVGRVVGPPAARASRQRQQDAARLVSTTQENLLAQPVVKAFGLEDLMTRRYASELAAATRSAIHLSWLSGLTGFTAQSITTAIQLTALGLGAWLVVTQSATPVSAWLNDGQPLTLGSLQSVLTLMAMVVSATQGLNGVLQMLQQASGPMDRVNELLRTTPKVVDAPDARPVDRLSEAIRLDDVWFGYNAAQPVLRGLSLTIPRGSRVGIVGPSGCGKSTALGLLQRLYDPQRGSVTFDSTDLRRTTLESVRSQEGMVFQDSVLFNLSVRENILMGKLDATDAEVEAAARMAEIHEVVQTLPEGYDTVVGERGSRLSGGQRQRIAIARAILRDPAILILDEATSALDPATEAALNATLRQVGGGRTTVSVTHRLGSVMHADQIFVLDGGRVAEQGTHEELIAKKGLYSRLWEEQMQAMAAAVGPRGADVVRLKKIPLLATVPDSVLAGLAGRLRAERFAAGDLLIRQGDAGDRLFLLEDGQAEVVVGDPSGLERHLATLQKGDYVGEIALLHDVTRTATVRAITAVQADTLAKEDFLRVVVAVPGLRETMERTMAERAAGLQGTPESAPAPAAAGARSPL